jgi:predicted dinucleotide-binding enzyme
MMNGGAGGRGDIGAFSKRLASHSHHVVWRGHANPDQRQTDVRRGLQEEIGCSGPGIDIRAATEGGEQDFLVHRGIPRTSAL